MKVFLIFSIVFFSSAVFSNNEVIQVGVNEVQVEQFDKKIARFLVGDLQQEFTRVELGERGSDLFVYGIKKGSTNLAILFEDSDQFEYYDIVVGCVNNEVNGNRVKICLNSNVTVNTSGRIHRISTTFPSIVRVQNGSTNDTLFLQGLAVGQTQVTARLDTGESETFQVTVLE